jgi:hypothetical protein
MIGSISFDLDDDIERKEFDMMLNAKCAIEKIDTYYDEVFRPIVKYRFLTDDQQSLLDEILVKLREHFKDLINE